MHARIHALLKGISNTLSGELELVDGTDGMCAQNNFRLIPLHMTKLDNWRALSAKNARNYPPMLAFWFSGRRKSAQTLSA
jgi:hypothetical protein